MPAFLRYAGVFWAVAAEGFVGGVLLGMDRMDRADCEQKQQGKSVERSAHFFILFLCGTTYSGFASLIALTSARS